MFEIEFSKNFAKALDRLSDNVVVRFYDDLIHVADNQFPSNAAIDIKKLQDKTDDYRLRVGKYRFIFTILDGKVLIYFYDLGSRGDVYK